jgi:8-oxo-dGTP pyrophosphatase MutT (NUDIX family)
MQYYSNSDLYCNNCKKNGHNYSQCKLPITSFGIVAFRYNNDKKIEYLMIRRKDTLGYIDFMRGKYFVNNKRYIMNMLKQMTIHEKEDLKCGDFDYLWSKLWGDNSNHSKYKKEFIVSKEKYNILFKGVTVNGHFNTLTSMIDESNLFYRWEEPEWGFPKGRPNFQEKDFTCAIREFCEETGCEQSLLKHISNICPFEEIFTGSNYKSYKHKYYLMFIENTASFPISSYEKVEVSKIEWKSFEDCLNSIRLYNLEKKRLITNINSCLVKYKVISSKCDEE